MRRVKVLLMMGLLVISQNVFGHVMNPAGNMTATEFSDSARFIEQNIVSKINGWPTTTIPEAVWVGLRTLLSDFSPVRMGDTFSYTREWNGVVYSVLLRVTSVRNNRADNYSIVGMRG